jgi:methyl-accepting chemotaxis protein
MDLLAALGVSVRDFILIFAGVLKQPAAPGLVALALAILLTTSSIAYGLRARSSVRAIRWFSRVLAATPADLMSGTSRTEVERQFSAQSRNPARRALKAAWDEYAETLVAHTEPDGTTFWRNALRPSVFFSPEELGFAPGFWRIVPGLFVTVGLFLTFLGLIAALNSMDLSADRVEASLRDLLTVASAKFIMSLTGLACSIVFTIILRLGLGSVEGALHRLCANLERRLSFVSLESLAAEQLAAMREQREHLRAFGLELVAELGRPLKEDIPNAISASIAAAIQPLFAQVAQIGSDGMGGMVEDLSKQFSDDVARALTQASDSLVRAGDRIGELSERMDKSSARVGTEVDGAAVRLAQAVDELRVAMGATATQTSGALNEGAERLVAVMNQTLEGIRDNTGAGAKAMSDAAGQMTAAAERFRTEIEGATRQGAGAATEKMTAAGDQTGQRIVDAGRNVTDALDRSAADVLARAERFAAQAAELLVAPLQQIQSQIGAMSDSLKDSASSVTRLLGGLQQSAEASQTAAGAVRGASQNLIEASQPVRASVEKIEGAMRQLAASTENVAGVVARSAAETAQSAARTLSAADAALGGHRDAIEASSSSLSKMLQEMKGQGERFDDIDQKLGAAVERIIRDIQTALAALTGGVKQLRAEIDPAIDTMRLVVDQAEKFIPQSGRPG